MIAYAKLFEDRETILEDLNGLINLLADCSSIEEKILETKTELDVVEAMVKALVEKRSKTDEISEEEFVKQYDSLSSRFKKLGEKLSSLKKEKEIKKGKKERMSAFLETLKNETEPIVKWDKRVWIMMVENAIVHRDKTITFKFYCGYKVRV